MTAAGAARRRLAPVLGFAVLALAAIAMSHFTGLRDHLTAEAIRRTVEALGWRGPFVLLAIAAVSPLLLLPRWPIAMVCGMLYGVAGGTVLGNFGGVAGAWLQYALARRALSPAAEPWADHPWTARLAQDPDHAFSILFLLRAFPFTSSIATSLLAGALRVRPGTYLAATFLGMLPSTLMYAAWGKLLKRPSPGFYLLAMLIAAGLAAASWFAGRRMLSRPDARRHSPAPGRP